MPPPPPPYAVNDPLGPWPFEHPLDGTIYSPATVPRLRSVVILASWNDSSRTRRNGIDLERRPDASRARRNAFDCARDDPFNPSARSAVPRAVRNAIDAATPDPFDPGRRDPKSQSPAQSDPRGLPQRAHTAPAQRTVDPRTTVRGLAPASWPPADLQWSIVTSAKPALPLPPVYLFSARDTSTPSTWHFGYGASPTAPEHVLSCRGPSLGSTPRTDSLDPLQYRYDHILSCYAAHSRVEKLLRAYVKHRESGCCCSLARFTGLGLTVYEARCETIWGPGFRAFFRSQKVRRLIDAHDGCCSCGCLGKRGVEYVGGRRMERFEAPAWCF